MELEADSEVLHTITDLQPGTTYMLCLKALGEFQNSTEVTHSVVTNTGKLPEKRKQNIDDLMQERRNSSVIAMELRFSCTKPSISSMVTPDSRASNACFLLCTPKHTVEQTVELPVIWRINGSNYMVYFKWTTTNAL